jgi:hypothetical protein
MRLMQMYDRNGVASLKGGSKFRHHIDWLPLFSLQLGLAKSGAAQPTDLGIVIRATILLLGVMNEAVGRGGNDSWLKVVVDRFEEVATRPGCSG